jgi:glycosyltransferase involved in cell wall biosynthesis
MRIGVYFTPTKSQGGIYSYSVSVLDALAKIKGNKYFVLSVSDDIPDKFFRRKNFKIVTVNPQKRESFLRFRDLISTAIDFVFPSFISFFYKIGLFNLVTPIYKFTQKRFLDILKNQKLDAMIYVSSSNLSFLLDVPSIVAVHDLQHKLQPEFKEVAAGGRWESREYSFTNISRNAYRVLVDSEVGREDMINCYGTDPSHVVSLPYLAPLYLRPDMTGDEAKKIINKLGLPDKYIFYPAKFWPHKNHVRLIKAIHSLRQSGKVVNLVLTGSKDAEFSTFNEVMSLIKKYNLNEQIFYLGYVENDELSAIYKCAQALVMPTFFGPTNIPILEAWKMGTPVVTSDIRGCRDQLGKAGLLANPRKVTDIADNIDRIYDNEKLRKILIKRGHTRVNSWTFDDFYKKIAGILSELKSEKNDKPKDN